MSRSREARTFALDTLIVAVTQGVQKLRALATLPLIVKLLGTESYGIWSQTLTFVGVVGTAFLFNLHLPLVRMIAADTEKKTGSIYSTILITQWAVFVVLALPFILFRGPLGAVVMGRHGLESFLLIGLLLILFGNVRLLNNNVYRATGRFGLRSALDLLSTFGGLAIMFWLLLRGSSIVTVLLALAAWEAITAISTTVHCLTITGVDWPRASVAKEALLYCLPLLPSGMAIVLLDRADRFFVGNTLGLRAVGVYSASYALANAMLLFEAPLQFTLFPKISALWDRDRALAGKYLSISIHVFLVFAIPCAVVMPIMAPRFLTLVGNSETGSAGPATMLFLCLGVLLWGVALCESIVFYASKNTVAMAKIIGASAIVNIAANAALVPVAGLLGAAVATFLSYLVACVWMSLACRKDLPLTWDWGFLTKSLLASLMVGLGLRWWSPVRGRGLVAAGLCGAALYLAILIASRAISSEHLARARAVFSRRPER